MFYNVSIATQKTCGLDGLEGLLVDEKEEYRKKIIEMVSKIEDVTILKLIFGFTRSGYNEEKAGD